jgi:hypothetical protein
VVGVALLVVVVTLLATTTMLAFSPLVEEQTHPGSYAIERSTNQTTFELTVQEADSSAPLDVRVDGERVTTFDPEDERTIELTNISAGDDVTFVTNGSVNEGQSYIVYATTATEPVGGGGSPALLDPPEAPELPVEGCIETVAELDSISLDGDHELCADIDASGIDEWHPIGDADQPFTGTLDGNGHTISGLTIDDDSRTAPSALFGYNEGEIRNLEVRNAKVRGDADVGPRGVTTLAGTNAGTIHNVSVTGSVEGTGDVGGLVAEQTASGRLSDATATGSVTLHGGDGTVGGLVASNDGTIVGSTASGTVSATRQSTVRAAGGIAGMNAGTIRHAASDGSVSVRSSDSPTGGLVGVNHGTVSRSVATATVTAPDGPTGGVACINGDGASIRDVYSTGAVRGETRAGGLVASNRGTVERTYAVGRVRASGRAGGSIASDTGSIHQSYWAPNATRQRHSAGGKGVRPRSLTAIRTKPGRLQGFGFGAIWDANGTGLPRLAWESS